MSGRAWVYVLGVVAAGAALSGVAVNALALPGSQLPALIVLTILATVAQVVNAEEADHQSYHATMVFLFAGVLLLSPLFFMLLVLIPHAIEWAKERLVKSPRLQAWYLQPFNISVHLISGIAAQWIALTLQPGGDSFLTPSSVAVMGIAALAYVLINHLLVGQAIVIARNVSLRESGVLDIENVVTDYIMLLLGSVVAVLWTLNPWLMVPALSPLVLIYRALMIPKLKKEARTDEKTGLWNARHFARLYEAEFARAKRFERPLSLIMADLDLLRNVNNTYGHLAGDVVLAGVGQIIRETIREYDVAGRFGGEEFTIALPETELVQAKLIAERLRRAVARAQFEVDTSPTPIQATLSLGVASFPTDASEPDALIHEADIAVYQAKLRGRNRVVVASDIPHFVRLEHAGVDGRLESPFTAVYEPRPDLSKQPPGRRVEESEQAGNVPPTIRGANGRSGGDDQGSSAPEDRARVWRTLFVAGVIAAGLLVSLLGFLAPGLRATPSATALFVVLAVVAEVLQVRLYEEGTISVSLAINCAAAVVSGVPGVVAVSATSALTHWALRRPELYKTAFNWATHVLAGSVVVAGVGAVAGSLELRSLASLVMPAVFVAVAYYAIETGLIATAIALSTGASIRTTWHRHYQWLAGHYVILCLMGIVLGIAYQVNSLLGVIVFVCPMLMLRYAQKQYVDRTEDGVRELKRMNQQLAQADREVVAASKAIRRLNDELFLVLSRIIDARDPYVHGHAAKVAEYATAVAIDLGLTAERVEGVRQAAFLHDIGKIVLTETILHKPDRLSDEEYDYVKSHTVLGAEFLEMSQGLKHLAPFTKHHHEWWDGSGYPDRLRGEGIPLEARILAVCDAVEAMASDRPYHRAMSVDEIIAELRRCAGTQFDPTVVDAFVGVTGRAGDTFVVNSAREVALNHAVDEGLLYHLNNGWFAMRSAVASTVPA